MHICRNGCLNQIFLILFDFPFPSGLGAYAPDYLSSRLHDEFGLLHHLEIIDDKYQTIVVEFNKEIAEIDRMFAHNYSTWGTVNLKEWIDNYESSRFTQFSRDTAIITSEYNMENLIKWLKEQDYIKAYQHITK